MELKSKLTTAIIIFSLLLGRGIVMQAQGVFDDKKSRVTTMEVTTEVKPESETGGTLFRDGGWGNGNDERPWEPAGEDEPVGEGMLILSLLTGCYALIKRKNRKKV